MNYWWVNQNQTFKQEVNGGYLWAPKRGKPNKRTGVAARIQFYENMREVAPGDLVFSFNNTILACVGIATSFCDEASRPFEFGNTGNQWENEGWKVSVDYHQLTAPIRPAEHLEILLQLLPKKYSPLKADGKGNQVYLSRISRAMASALIGIMGPEAQAIVDLAMTNPPADSIAPASSESPDAKESAIEAKIATDPKIPETEKQALITARKGQGLFRQRVAKIEKRCRLTGVANPFHLIASHIKPWSKSNNLERLDGENGLLLTPHVDHLFDKGFISFAEDGTLLISPIADEEAFQKMGIPKEFNCGAFTPGQQKYLQFHRAVKFKKANAA